MPGAFTGVRGAGHYAGASIAATYTPPPTSGGNYQFNGSLVDGTGRGTGVFVDGNGDLYMVGDVYAVWFSRDQGATWKPLCAGLNHDASAISSENGKGNGLHGDGAAEYGGTDGSRYLVLISGGGGGGGVWVLKRTSAAADPDWANAIWENVSYRYYLNQQGGQTLRENGRRVCVTPSGRAFVSARDAQHADDNSGLITFDCTNANPSSTLSATPFGTSINNNRHYTSLRYSSATDCLYASAEYATATQRADAVGNSSATHQGLWLFQQAQTVAGSERKLTGGTAGGCPGDLRNIRDLAVLNYGGNDNVFLTCCKDETNTTVTGTDKSVWKVAIATATAASGTNPAASATWTPLTNSGGMSYFDKSGNWCGIEAARIGGVTKVWLCCFDPVTGTAQRTTGTWNYSADVGTPGNQYYFITHLRCDDADKAAGTAAGQVSNSSNWTKITNNYNIQTQLVVLGSAPLEYWCMGYVGYAPIESSAIGRQNHAPNMLYYDPRNDFLFSSGKSGVWRCEKPAGTGTTFQNGSTPSWLPANQCLGAISIERLKMFRKTDGTIIVGASDVDRDGFWFGQGIGRKQPSFILKNTTRGISDATLPRGTPAGGDARDFLYLPGNDVMIVCAAADLQTATGVTHNVYAYANSSNLVTSATPPTRYGWGKVGTNGVAGLFLFQATSGDYYILAVASNGIYRANLGPSVVANESPTWSSVYTATFGMDDKIFFAKSGTNILVWAHTAGFYRSDAQGDSGSWTAFTTASTKCIADGAQWQANYGGFGQDKNTATTVYFTLNDNNTGIRKWTNWHNTNPPSSADATLNSGFTDTTSAKLAALCVNPDDGQIYCVLPGIADTPTRLRYSHLFRVNPTTGAATEYTDPIAKHGTSMRTQCIAAMGDYSTGTEVILWGTDGGGVMGRYQWA